MAMMIW